MLGFIRRSKPSIQPDGAAYKHNNKSLIELRDVRKTFKVGGDDFVALKSIDLQIDAGEFVGIIGKSGSGKSTLINMITRIDIPTSGEVYIGNVALHAMKERDVALWRGKTIGVVFQFFQLIPTLNVLENVMLPMDFCDLYTPRERKRRALELLDLVDVGMHARKLPSALSGGQQQRVAIARALSNDPPLILADEPTGNLDSKTSDQVFTLFEDLVSRGKTIIMVTHDDDKARRVQRTIIIADGSIVNNYIARALPKLDHTLLLTATKAAEEQTFQSGEVIIAQGSKGEHFYVITDGVCDVLLRHPEGRDICVDTMTAGQFFGETALVEGGERTATVRASMNAPVKVIALHKADFEGLLQDSDATRQQVVNVIQERAARRKKSSSSTN